MKLGVKEAAALLGKPPRTIRHLAQHGKLPAERVGQHWVFDRAELIAHDPDAAAARAQDVARVRHHVDSALDAVTPPGPEPQRGFYSIRDVTAFRIASSVLAAVEAAGQPALQSAASALRTCLHHLTDGFHQFQPPLKIQRLLDARAACCAGIAELLHAARHLPMAEATAWADELERDALGSLRGLIRRAEKRL